VHQWILYKVAATAFDCIRGTGPAYFKLSARWFQTSLVGHPSMLPNAATCWLFAQELSSADRVFELLHRLSGTLLAHLRSTLISLRQFRDGLKSHLFADAYF